MSAFDLQSLMLLNASLQLCLEWPIFCNRTGASALNLSDALDLYVPGDGSPWLRAIIASLYFAVSAVGLVGNATVLFLLQARGGAAKKGTINLFVFHLAVTDLLFSAATPLWATEAALDYCWPFGWAACKAACFLTSLNLFASVSFLAAMSVTRYCSVASALQRGPVLGQGVGSGWVGHLATALIWGGSVLAAAPRGIFAELADVGGDSVCLMHFPNGTYWLGLHHLLRVVLGFLLPYAIIILSYLLLLCFLCNHSSQGHRHGDRQARVSRSVAVVILSFCVCWLPNNVLTFWGLLIHLDVAKWSSAFYLVHTYVFPLTSCLAQVNGCLNPILYCLVRQEHRQALRGLLSRHKMAAKACLSKLGCRSGDGGNSYMLRRSLTLPLNGLESHNGVREGTKLSAGEPPPSTILTAVSSKCD